MIDNININELSENLEKEFTHYYGLEFASLAAEFGLNVNLIKGKLTTVKVINKMLIEAGIDKKNFVYQGVNVAVKTVNLKENSVPKESMSFEQIDFYSVAQEEWNSSFIKKKFLHTIFCFFVFQEVDKKVYFRGVKVWKMPAVQVDNEVMRFWSHLKAVLDEGVVTEKQKKGTQFITVNNLPTSSDNTIMHVRPKAKDSNDTTELPCGQLITKQAYWINASFLAKVLKDLPTVNKKVGKRTKKNIEINWNEVLKSDIYSINDIINKGKSLRPEFTEWDIDDGSLLESGYRIESSYVIRADFGSIDDYLYKKIFSSNYFDSKSETIFDTPYFRRKIENLENAYKLLKVEESVYLTETGIRNANVDIVDVKSFREDVEGFVSENCFFTLETIRTEGFSHVIDEFGFEPMFYENLLKRPGRLKSISFSSKIFFIKTAKKVSQGDLICSVLDGRNHITIDELITEVKNLYKVRLSFEGIESVVTNLNDLYYVPEMKRLFASKDDFLDFLE